MADAWSLARRAAAAEGLSRPADRISRRRPHWSGRRRRFRDDPPGRAEARRRRRKRRPLSRAVDDLRSAPDRHQPRRAAGYLDPRSRRRWCSTRKTLPHPEAVAGKIGEDDPRLCPNRHAETTRGADRPPGDPRGPQRSRATPLGGKGARTRPAHAGGAMKRLVLAGAAFALMTAPPPRKPWISARSFPPAAPRRAAASSRWWRCSRCCRSRRACSSW